MSSMKFELSVETSDPSDQVVTRLRDYLIALGYKAKVTAREDSLKLSRGSIWGTLTGLSPRRWKSLVTIVSTEAPMYRVQYDINITGQMITDPERLFWEMEKENVTFVLKGKAPVSLAEVESEISSLVKDAFRYSFGFAILGALIGVMTIVIFKLIGIEYSMISAPGFGAGTGAAYGMAQVTKGK